MLHKQYLFSWIALQTVFVFLLSLDFINERNKFTKHVLRKFMIKDN